MFSDNNIGPKLSKCTLEGNPTTAPINNKTPWINNSISQHISMTTEYSNSVTNNLMVYEYENTILQQICLLEQHVNVSIQHYTQGC